MRSVEIRWLGPVLDASAIARTPGAAQLSRHLHAYDDALARHGAPESMRIPSGFRVEVFRYPDAATGGDDRIALSVTAKAFREPTVASADVVRHELAHGSIHRSPMSLEATKEGWPDAVSRSIAIEGGDDAVRPWSMSRDGYRASPDAPWGDMRDPLTARHTHVADLDERVSLVRAYEESRFGESEREALGDYLGMPLSAHARGYHLMTMMRSGHAEAGIVTKPAAIASATLGPRLVAGAYLDAFAQLPAYVRAARADIGAANRAGEQVQYPIMQTAYYAELLGSARGTIDAVESPKRGAGDVMRAAWCEVGVEA